MNLDGVVDRAARTALTARAARPQFDTTCEESSGLEAPPETAAVVVGVIFFIILWNKSKLF